MYSTEIRINIHSFTQVQALNSMIIDYKLNGHKMVFPFRWTLTKHKIEAIQQKLV